MGLRYGLRCGLRCGSQMWTQEWGSGVGSGVGLGLGLGSSSGLSQDTDAHPCSSEAAHGSEDSEADWTGGVESRRQSSVTWF